MIACLVAQSRLTFCDPKDSSPLNSSFHEILQARILEWVAIPFSRVSFWFRDWTWVSCIAGRFFTTWATCWIKWFEDKTETGAMWGARKESQGMQTASRSQKTRKDSPLEPPQGARLSPCDQTSILQSCDSLKLCCLSYPVIYYYSSRKSMQAIWGGNLLIYFFVFVFFERDIYDSRHFKWIFY